MVLDGGGGGERWECLLLHPRHRQAGHIKRQAILCVVGHGSWVLDRAFLCHITETTIQGVLSLFRKTIFKPPGN